jgi:hypothetical protein
MNESNLNFIMNSLTSISAVSGLYATDLSYNDASGIRQIFQDLYAAYPSFESPLLTFLNSSNTIGTPTLQIDVSGAATYASLSNGVTNSAYNYNFYYSSPTTITLYDVSQIDVSGNEYLAPTLDVSSIAVESILNNPAATLQLVDFSYNKLYTMYGVVANNAGGVSAASNKVTFSKLGEIA